MRSRIALAVAGLAAVAAVSMVAVTLASAGGTPSSTSNSLGRWAESLPPGPPSLAEDTTLGSGPQHIILIENENQGRSQTIDVGDPGISPGDYTVFRDPLYDQDQQKKQGNLTVQCIDLFAVFLCHGNVELAGRGKIAFNGTAPPYPAFLLPLTGGTKEFEHATGEIRVTIGVPGEGLDTIDVDFDPVG
jgi:hypothetical protein